MEKQTRLFSTGSAMEKWLRVMTSGQRSHAQARSREMDAHGFSRHNTGFSPIQTEVKPALSELITGFWFSTEVYTGFSVQKVYEIFLQSLGQSYCLETVHPQAVFSNERVNPPHSPPKLFYSHAPMLTLVTLEAACVPPACITFPWSGT